MTIQPHTRRWELAIPLDSADDLPLYLQIARSISADIRAGYRVAGEALPGGRTLAQTLGVHRNTVLAAYTELVTEGLVRTEVAGGTFVSDNVGARKRTATDARPTVAHQPGYKLDAATSYEVPPAYASGTLVLAKGAPNVRLLPSLDRVAARQR